MDGRELRGRGRVAERDDGGQRPSDEQPGAGGGRGGRESGEDARADHRAETDDDGVAETEPARQSGGGDGASVPEWGEHRTSYS